ncbi:MAG: hypothetical protein LBC83_00755 [Oscillospiraceae bacterium]|nr:hypothetical protein [Oscillospiraceae bacterium]
MEVRFSFAAMLALCFAAASARRVGIGLLFAAAHEAGHLAALFAFGMQPRRVCLHAAGICIERPPGLRLSYNREFAAALAGPAVSAALAVLFFFLRRRGLGGDFIESAVWMNAGFAFFNLLPVRQLDGGRALYAVLCVRLPEAAARRFVRISSVGTLCAAAVLAAVQLWRGAGTPSLLLAVVYLAVCA